MDINQSRIPSQELRKIISLLKFDKNSIEFVGSSGTASNRYDTDYDLYSSITPTPTPEKAYNEIIKIIDKTKNNPNIYFTEYKIQQKNNNKKTKFYDVEGLSGGGLFSYVSDEYQNIKNKVSSYFSYPTKLNNVSTKTLQQYGGQEITALNIYRTPIASMLDKVINLVSLGTWEREKKNVGYDKLFHLALIVTLKNGKNIVIEKNEVINISTFYKTHSDTEVFHIPFHNQNRLTLQRLIDKTKDSISEKDFYDYSAFQGNCQNFISNILKANGLYNNKIDNFVFQDLTEIIKHMPNYVGKVADTVTRTGAIVNKVIGGGTIGGGGLYKTIKNKGIHYMSNVSNFKLNANFPLNKIMFDAIDNAYNKEKRDDIDGYKLIYSTPSLVFYKKGDIIIVGVRGTADANDVKADLKIATGTLTKSKRYLDDFETMKYMHKEYPNATYYGVGHSLGGSLVDKFLKLGLLSQAISYNPAIETEDMKNTGNKRIYMEDDPLFDLMGKYATNVEVRKGSWGSFLKNNIFNNLSPITSIYNTGTSHLLNNFVGGSKRKDYKDKEAFLSAFKNVEYLKIDFVVRIGNIFRELSILYNMDVNITKEEKIENSLKDDIHEYINQKNYYKALRRLNSLYKIQGRNRDQIPLIRFFNTKIGEMYQTIANLKAIQLLPQNKNTEAKEKVNMKDLHLIPNLSLIPKYIRDYNKIIQKEAKQLWTKLKPLKGQHISSASSAKKGIESLSLQQLRKAIKEYGLSKKMKGYTKLKKEELIKRLLKEGHIKMVGGGEGDSFIYNYILEPVFDWAVSKLWNGLKNTDYEKRDQMRKPY